VSECEACNTRSEKVSSDNLYETSLCPRCVDVWDSESGDDDLSECASCGNRVATLHTVWDMYSVCESCIDNHDVAEEHMS